MYNILPLHPESQTRIFKSSDTTLCFACLCATRGPTVNNIFPPQENIHEQASVKWKSSLIHLQPLFLLQSYSSSFLHEPSVPSEVEEKKKKNTILAFVPK